MTMTLLLNHLRAVSVRLLIPWVGAWIADVDFDLDETRRLPSGRATLRIDNAILVGTVDGRATGIFGEKGKARIVGGGGGWDKPVERLHFHNDGSLMSSAVLNATAAEVGEIIVDRAPTRLGIDYVRTAGPASRVLAGRPWHVDFTGTTIAGPRLPASTRAEILTWHPNAQRAELASDTIVVPGTVLTDSRIGRSVTVHDIEQTFGDGGARATAWCGLDDSTRLVGALSALAREAAGVAYLKTYRYRVVAQNADGRLLLQAVAPAAGVPDALPISVWPGMAGLAAKLTPGSEVLVQFIAGDPTRPIVHAFDGERPIELDLDATTRVVVGLGLQPVALASSVLSAISALQVEIAAVAAALVAVTGTPTTPNAPLLPSHATAAAAATVAVTAGAAAVSTATATAPSIKLFSE